MFMSCKKDNADASYPTPAPTNAAVQAGDGSVTLRWTAPESENLKEYSITWTPGDGQATVQAEPPIPSPSPPCTTTGKNRKW